MLRIGDFAQIAQVSTSTLRYYDEVGLFSPARVDPVTGYRLYSIDQLAHFNRILSLRDLGIDLPQIAHLLERDLSDEAFHGMLVLRKAQLERDMQATQEQLARVKARIRHIESGNQPPPEIVVKAVRAIPVVASYTGVTGFLPNAEYASVFAEKLRRRRIRLTGYTHFLYHPAQTEQTEYEVELAMPVEAMPDRELRGIAQDGAVVCELPEVARMASAVHRGSPYTIAQAYQALGSWLQASGYTITGLCRKVCLRWSGPLDDYLTEIQFPVEMQPH